VSPYDYTCPVAIFEEELFPNDLTNPIT